MHKIKLFFLLGILVSSTSFLLAQKVDISQLDAYFAKAQKEWDVPGMSVGIIKDGKVLLSKGYGVVKQGSDQATDGNTLYAIASNTKAFISASIGILVDEGKLNWDDPVKKYLPYFELYDSYVTEHATIRDLLCHRLGLGTFSGDAIWYKSDYTAKEALMHLKFIPQAYEFRSGYGYSNLMFITAGEVIQAVSGKSWAEFVKEKIFSPLGMNRSVTSISHLKDYTNVASPHKPSYEGIGENHPIPWVNWDNAGAAGGIISSVNDMLKWAQLQMDHGIIGEQTIFSTQAQDEFWKPHNNFKVTNKTRLYYPTRNFSAYALGWGCSDKAGKMVYSHGGGYDGMYSRVTIVPDEGLAIIVLTNSMKGISTAITNYALDSFLALPQKDWSTEGMEAEKRFRKRRKHQIDERKNAQLSGTKPSLDLEAYAATYHAPIFGDIHIRYQNNQLTLEFPKAKHLNATLSHWHKDVFLIHWQEEHAWFDFGTIQFILDNNLQPQSIQFDIPNDDIFFEEIKGLKVDKSELN